jgi:murein DD-endopeptidase MepM/ murein hydrolase activator NlpD
MTADTRLAAISGAIGFLAGAVVVAVMGIVWERRHSPETDVVSPGPPVVEGAPMSQMTPGTTAVETAPTPPVVRPPDVAPAPRLYPEAVADLRARRLDVPVFGTKRDTLRPMFDQQRSGDRTHEAIDILAPTGTPVVAVEDGTIAKLFLSEAGGITIYQFDPTNRYAYYYAHLDAYAPGLADRAAVTRGQTIGYVGASGNAPKNTPHLHFAIFELTAEKRWWQGTPIDPFLVLK